MSHRFVIADIKESPLVGVESCEFLVRFSTVVETMYSRALIGVISHRFLIVTNYA